MSSSKKRTRISRGQSKLGCFTCRARKIKCDETKPSCLKCLQAKFTCEGYPSAAFGDRESTDSGQSSHDYEEPAGETSLLHLSPENYAEVIAPDLHAPKLAPLQRLASVGLNLLINSYGDEHVVGQYALRRLISGHVKSSTAVSIACAALGAAVELQQQEGRPENLNVAFEEHYGQAMSLVKQDIARSDYDRDAIVAACIILASVETVLWRRQDAIKHLLGAYQVFHLSQLGREPITNAISPSETNRVGTRDIANTDIDFSLRTLDINTMKFASYTRAPVVPPFSLQMLESFSPGSTVNSISRLVVYTLHATFAFVNRAVFAAVEGPSVYTIERERNGYVSLLHRTVTLLTGWLEGVPRGPERIQLSVLRNLCLAATIETQASFAENENTWDLYADGFLQIITSAEAVAQHLVAWRARKNLSHTTDYTAQISTLQPLYLAALKYRHKAWRQRAITALRLIGREGPWIGEMMAAIAQRVTELEESLAMTISTNTNSLSIYPSNAINHSQNNGPARIPEFSRIAHVSIQDDNGEVNDVAWPLSNSGRTAIRLLRRRQPASVLAPLLLTSAQFRTSDTGSAHPGTRQLDTNVWEQWDEDIEFGPGMHHRVLVTTSAIPQVTNACQ